MKPHVFIAASIAALAPRVKIIMNHRSSCMKTSAFLALLMASAALAPIQATAEPPKTITFSMVKPGAPAPAASCPNSLKPSATVIDHTFGDFENLEVFVTGLPPNTGFDLFSIQVPHAKFGLAWYIGDIQTDINGKGVGNFVGRFNKETFIVSQAALPSVNTFPKPPANLPQSKTGAQVDPVQLYHLGLWFNSADDAAKAGCPNNHTPFNGEHDAGIQILNTGNFPDDHGPLLDLQ
jgi:hypothetical protein